MAANILQPIAEHRLLKIDVKRGDTHTNYFTAHCTCGWKSDAGVVKQRFAEATWESHAEGEGRELKEAEFHARLGEQMEDILVFVADCERSASDEDRIDTIARYSR